jgi:hypothetical protein
MDTTPLTCSLYLVASAIALVYTAPMALDGQPAPVETLSFALFIPALTALTEVFVFGFRKILCLNSFWLTFMIIASGLGLTALTVFVSNHVLAGLEYNTKVTGSVGIVTQALVHLLGQLRLLENEKWRDRANSEADAIDQLLAETGTPQGGLYMWYTLLRAGFLCGSLAGNHSQKHSPARLQGPRHHHF